MYRAIVIALVVSLLFVATPHFVSAEPYWSCRETKQWVWVGWPTFWERHNVTICEVKEY